MTHSKETIIPLAQVFDILIDSDGQDLDNESINELLNPEAIIAAANVSDQELNTLEHQFRPLRPAVRVMQTAQDVVSILFTLSNNLRHLAYRFDNAVSLANQRGGIAALPAAAPLDAERSLPWLPVGGQLSENGITVLRIRRQNIKAPQAPHIILDGPEGPLHFDYDQMNPSNNELVLTFTCPLAATVHFSCPDIGQIHLQILDNLTELDEFDSSE